MLWQPVDLCYGTMSLSLIHFWCMIVLVFLPVAFDEVRWPTYLFSFSRFTFYFHVFVCGAKKTLFMLHADVSCSFTHMVYRWKFRFNLFRMDFLNKLRSSKWSSMNVEFLNAFSRMINCRWKMLGDFSQIGPLFSPIFGGSFPWPSLKRECLRVQTLSCRLRRNRCDSHLCED